MWICSVLKNYGYPLQSLTGQTTVAAESRTGRQVSVLQGYHCQDLPTGCVARGHTASLGRRWHVDLFRSEELRLSSAIPHGTDYGRCRVADRSPSERAAGIQSIQRIVRRRWLSI